MSKDATRHYRLCILGPSFVGKSQLINRFMNNGFSPFYDPTLHSYIYRRAFSLMDPDNAAEMGGDSQTL
jgi:GTPase SAR1 family protein